MSSGLDRTFEILTRASHKAAADALLTALDVPDDAIRCLAVRALISRRDTPASREVVRRWPEFSAEARAVIERNAPLVSPTLRQCLLHGDEVLRRHALQMLPTMEDFGQISALLNLLESGTLSNLRPTVEQAIGGLIDRLYEHLRFGKEPMPQGSAPRFLRDAPRIRHQVLDALNNSAQRYEIHQSPRVVECLIALCRPDDPQLKQVVRNPASPLGRAALEILRTSTHPGVMSLLVESQSHPAPPMFMTTALMQRQDPEFLCELLRHWPRRLTAVQQKNFRDIRTLGWMVQRPFDLEVIPPSLHDRLVGFVMATGIPLDDKLEVLEWLVRNGSADGRQVATEILADVPDDRIHEVVIEGLESEAEDIQAWATTQLRTREIPGAIEMLLERIDSPLADVREAARKELGDFNIGRVLEMFDSLDDVRAHAVGRVVKKIDPETIDKLKCELLHPIHRRRARAIRCAERVGWLGEVLAQVVLRLDDEDPMVRRTAVECLSAFPATAEKELPRLMQDSSARVRESAIEVLERVGLAEPAKS
jgi:HEAT repeat protein